MPEVLFYELMTCPPVERASLFRKIGAEERPIELVSNPGWLFGREMTLGRKCHPVLDSELNGVRWIFNAGLVQSEFVFPEKVQTDIVQWRARKAEAVASFVERSSAVSGFIPSLKGLKAGARGDIVRSVLNELGGDSAAVREVHSQLAAHAGENIPPEFGPDWIGFRLLQAELIWAVDNMSRYGDGVIAVPMKDLENTVCDIEYAVIASKADVLLTRDKRLAANAAIMVPGVAISDGTLP